MSSILLTAGPHKGNESFTFENATHEPSSQNQYVIDWLMGDPSDPQNNGYKLAFMEKMNEDGKHADFTVDLFSFLTVMDEIMQYLIMDGALIILALLFVYIYFAYNIGSKLLAAVAISIIFLSFPVTALIVQGIF
jgi:hypothetical protein